MNQGNNFLNLNAIWQVKAGHVVMSVDCTNILNLRHINEKDNAWLTEYPTLDPNFSYDQVTIYGDKEKDCDVAIITYGNGMIPALQVKELSFSMFAIEL